MTKQMFKEFQDFAKEVFGCDVYETTPEDAIIVGGFYENSIGNDYCVSINKEETLEKLMVFNTNDICNWAA